MTWTQSYTPLGNLLLSALVASLPVVVLLGLLAFSHVKAHIAALLGLAASLTIAIFVYRMPVHFAALAAIDGAAFGLFPIGWIVLCAIFVYDITVKTGQFEIVKQSIAGLADDRRIQAILIAFCFGSFIEGAAGFGTPVAISAAMLIGLGFKPLTAAGLALIGNTAPVAFGGLGIPIQVLHDTTGLPLNDLSAMIGRQLAPFGLLIPFWLVWAMSGWRKMLEVWPACLTAGLSFGAAQFFISTNYGPSLVAIGSSLASILSLLVLLRFWQPKTAWRFGHEGEDAAVDEAAQAGASSSSSSPASVVPYRSGTAALAPPLPATRWQMLIAWMPWMLLSVLIFTTGRPTVKKFLDDHSPSDFAIPGLHQKVLKVEDAVKQVDGREEIVKQFVPEKALFKRNFLSATGSSLFLAGILSGLLLRIKPMDLLRIFAGTLHRVRWSLLTISAMMALGYTTRFAGSDVTMGLAFARTGWMFPFFSPLLGWLGTALTGSDTSSNVLFGNLQKITAQGLHLNPVLFASANSSGGVMGKMIDAQSIVVAGVATDQRGGEGKILRFVFFHSVALAILMGLLVLLQAYVLK
jgi:lactate permease